MEIRLHEGESLFVTFDSSDDDEDGIKIDYEKSKLFISAEYEDDKGRQGEIYCATFDDDPEVDDKTQTVDSDREEVVKTISCNRCGQSFNLTKGEQRFMQGMFKDNYHDPVRCRRCRKIRMNRQQPANGKKRKES